MPVKLVDDSDYSVAYYGSWSLRTFTLLPSHASGTANDSATLSFSGIGVEVEGVAQNEQSYTIDGGNPTVMNYTAFTLGFRIIFTSPILGDGQHTLTVTNLHSNRDDDNIIIGYFNVRTADNASTPSSAVAMFTASTSIPSSESVVSISTFTASTLINSTSTSLSRGGRSSSSTKSGTATDLVPFASSESSSYAQPHSTDVSDSGTIDMRNSPHRKAAIIGAVVAIATLAILILYLWLRRRRKKLENESEPWEFVASADTPAPVKYTTIRSAHPAQIIERPSSSANYSAAEPPPYDTLDVDLTSAPRGGPQHLVDHIKLTR